MRIIFSMSRIRYWKTIIDPAKKP